MCSGGPDSMALLDIIYNKGYEIFVAHVNYQKRESAIRDERIVIEYCESRNIDLQILKPDFDYQSNFQAWARDVRYDFAKKLAKENKCDLIMVAHQLDDVLETYLMQKKRGSIPSHYGINETLDFEGYTIYRPLLHLTKKDLENYCLENGVNYGIDESNMSDDYQRNRIRHQIIDKMTKTEKLELLKEINDLNALKDKEEKEYMELVSANKYCSINVFKDIKDKELFIRLFIDKGLSSDYIEELINQILNSSKFKITFDNKVLIKEYDMFYLKEEKSDYSYSFDKIEYVKQDFFEIKDSGSSFEAVTVDDEDFPITIRNYQKGDKIIMKYGTKKLSRWFIDNKIPTYQREKWPVVCNRNGEIILVPEIGCDLKHYSNNPSFFVVQYLIN